MRAPIGLGLVFSLFAAAAAAQDAPPPETRADPNAAEDRIVVTGRRLEGQTLYEFASDFIAEIGDPLGSGRDFGYARWEGRLCVGVENIEPARGQYVVDRISQAALDVGLKVGEPGCDPQLSIIFSTDGAALASHLVETQPRLFRPFGGTGGTQKGFEALDEFATSQKAIRWWQLSMVVDRAGNTALELPKHKVRFPCLGAARICINNADNSRITNTVRDELVGAIVIVDVSKLEGVSWGQIADYLAMVTLAQIEADSEPSAYDTILNLFRASSAPPRMTQWDQSYLRALYEFERHRKPDQQLSALSWEMVRQQDE